MILISVAPKKHRRFFCVPSAPLCKQDLPILEICDFELLKVPISLWLSRQLVSSHVASEIPAAEVSSQLLQGGLLSFLQVGFALADDNH